MLVDEWILEVSDRIMEEVAIFCHSFLRVHTGWLISRHQLTSHFFGHHPFFRGFEQVTRGSVGGAACLALQEANRT